MEWIETTGVNVDEAKERALDRLGVAEDELEYEILAEPTSLLFGLRRTEARLRARVRPLQPWRKENQRNRSQKGKAKGKQKSSSARSGGAKEGEESGKPTRKRSSNGRKGSRSAKEDGRSGGKKVVDESSNRPGRKGKDPEPTTPRSKQNTHDQDKRNRKSEQNSSSRGIARENNSAGQRRSTETTQMDLETQARVTEDFVGGLLEKMGLNARVVSSINEDRLLVEAQGLNLGLAIGQRGETVKAITQLARTMVQRMSDGDAEGSLVVDIGGYRERRRSFLMEFASTQADEVLGDGRPRALEAMNSADRKVVHDAIAEIEGVTTESEGSDRDRHVVIFPLVED